MVKVAEGKAGANAALRQSLDRVFDGLGAC